MNDNILPLLIEEDKESLIWRVELTTKKISFFLKGGAIVWKTMMDGREDFTHMPSDDKVTLTYERDYVRFTKLNATAFTYEDVKYFLLKAHAQRLMRASFCDRLIAIAKNNYAAPHTIFNPDRSSAFSEISVKSGLHLFFHNEAERELEPLVAVLQQELKEKARPAIISSSGPEVHIIGDEINRNAIEVMLLQLENAGYVLPEAREIFIHLVMTAHVKNIAQRELAILQHTLSTEEKELYAPYIEVFRLLKETGEFAVLGSTLLTLLLTLYENRKDIYSFPLMIRIPLRSIYICFHEEIEQTLQGVH
jgi:hypothetical protein